MKVSHSRRRRRSLIPGRIRNLLLTLGLVGLILGAGMGILAFLKDNRKIAIIAAAYVLSSILLLLVRQVSMLLDSAMRKKEKENEALESMAGTPEASATSPAEEERGGLA